MGIHSPQLNPNNMSQLPGLKYLITRDGENGKLGSIHAALQVVETSPLIEMLTEGRWYLGAKEEWEAYSKSMAGDLDGDGDYDEDDKALIKLLNDRNR